MTECTSPRSRSQLGISRRTSTRSRHAVVVGMRRQGVATRDFLTLPATEEQRGTRGGAVRRSAEDGPNRGPNEVEGLNRDSPGRW